MSVRTAYNPFTVNPEVAALYNGGMTAVDSGRPFEIAMASFEGGLRFLGVPEGYIDGTGNPDQLVGAHVPLQVAEGFRELGTVCARRALEFDGQAALTHHAKAWRLIQSSKVVSHTVLDSIKSGELHADKPRIARTLGVVGAAHARQARAISAQNAQNLTGRSPELSMTEDDHELLLLRQRSFSHAEDYLVMSDNGLERLVNALIAARDLRIFDAAMNSESVKNWLDVMRDAFCWIKSEDPENYRRARSILWHRSFALRKPAIALRATISPSKV